MLVTLHPQWSPWSGTSPLNKQAVDRAVMAGFWPALGFCLLFHWRRTPWAGSTVGFHLFPFTGASPLDWC